MRPILKTIWNRGEINDELFMDKQLSELDERIVEYPMALYHLIKVSQKEKKAMKECNYRYIKKKKKIPGR